MDAATYGAALRATLTNSTDSARLVLPNLLGAAALLFGGWLLALLLQKLSARVTRRFDGLARRSHVDGALQRIGVERPLSEIIGAFVFWTVFLFFVAGATEAFGLGARTAVSNIIGSHYIRQIVRVGQTVRLGVVQGEVEAITPTAVVLKNGDGRVIVPAKEFNEAVSLLPSARA
ncbi:MAG: mechanosensitive ion channel [Actinobacteria bacterium]|nr:mechanosensitive ion channel [Actinomycetota bacterium]